MECKKSNKIREIVRLQQILKKWRKIANSSKPPTPTSTTTTTCSPTTTTTTTTTTNSNSGGASKSIKFLKRTLSLSERSSSDGGSSSEGSSSNGGAVPKGYLAVSVGVEQKRFTIPTEYLSHPAFHILLREAEEEFGFQQAGVLRIPCEVSVFESVVRIVEKKKDGAAVSFMQQQQDCRFDVEDGSAAGYGYCSLPGKQSSTPAHHPQSPMCR